MKVWLRFTYHDLFIDGKFVNSTFSIFLNVDAYYLFVTYFIIFLLQQYCDLVYDRRIKTYLLFISL